MLIGVNESEVEEIVNNAFDGLGITSVEIPSSVTEIGANAFNNNNLITGYILLII